MHVPECGANPAILTYDRSIGRSIGVAGLALAAAATVAILLPHSSSPAEDPFSSSSLPAPTPPVEPFSRHNYYTDGVCQVPATSDSPSKLRTKAQACADAYQTGKIALVDYNDDFTAATELAADITDRLNLATNGLVHSQVVAVKPEPAAVKEFNTYSCVDHTNVQSWGTVNAIHANPALAKDYDVVASFTAKTDCAHRSLGFANVNGGFAEILDADSASPQAAKTATHEFGHAMLSLGHTQTLMNHAGNDYDPIDVVQAKDEVWDIPGYASQTTYSPTGQICTVMGPSNCLSTNRLSYIQQEMIRWPNRILDNEADRFTYLTPGNPLEVTENDSDSIVVVNLRDPVHTQPDDDAPGARYDQLMITPHRTPFTAPTSGTSFALVKGTETAEIGALSPAMGEVESVKDIMLGPNQTLHVEYHGQAMKLSLTEAPEATLINALPKNRLRNW